MVLDGYVLRVPGTISRIGQLTGGTARKSLKRPGFERWKVLAFHV
jgi:hypothetical protein